jgi:hypothetical protein
VDYYALEVNAKLGTMKIGGYGLYTLMNSYPLTSVSSTYGARAPYTAEMWWVGIYGEGKLGPVNLILDFVIDRGEVEAKNVSGVRDAKYRGWATRFSLEVPIDKFVVGGSFRYGSGADMKKTGPTGLPGTSVSYGSGSTTKVGSYVIPPGEGGKPEDGIVLFYGSTRTTSEPKFVTDDYGRMNRGYMGGTWFAKLFFKFKAAPWYTADFGVMYIGDTTKHGNTIGTARKKGTSLPRDDSDIGIEIGLWNDFLIYKNLDLNIGLGYLFAGDAMEYWNGTKNVEPDNPWAINTRIRYRF